MRIYDWLYSLAFGMFHWFGYYENGEFWVLNNQKLQKWMITLRTCNGIVENSKSIKEAMKMESFLQIVTNINWDGDI